MADIHRYVDPDVSGGAGDGTTWADAYSSLNAWETAEQTNLNTAKNQHTCHCRASSGTADTTTCYLNPWVTSTTYWLKIVTDNDSTYGYNRHDGKWNTSKYRLETTTIPVLNAGANVSGLIIDGMQISYAGTTNTAFGIILAPATASASIRISNCIIRKTSASSNNSFGINFFTASAGSAASVWNTLVYGWAAANNIGVRIGPLVGWTSVTLYNCTISNCTTGAGGKNTLHAYNCAVFNNGNDFGTMGTIDHCASDDGDGTNAVDWTSEATDWANVFVDYANKDFHLLNYTGTGKIIGMGITNPLSGAYTDDIDGETRTDPWDIGADEYVSTAQVVEPTGMPSDAAFGTPGFNLSITVQPSGIATAEAFGTPQVSGAATQNVNPTGIESAAAFGIPQFSFGAATVSPTGITSDETFGTPSLLPTTTINATGITSAETFGIPAILLTIALSVMGIASAQSFGDPNLLPGSVAVQPSGIETQEVFGTPLVSATGMITVFGIDSAAAFGAPQFSFGSVQIEPTGIASDEAFGMPDFYPLLLLSMTGLDSDAAFGLPQFSFGAVSISPAGLETEALFGFPDVGQIVGDMIFILGDSVPSYSLNQGDSIVSWLREYYGKSAQEMLDLSVPGTGFLTTKYSPNIPTQYANGKAAYGVPRVVILDGAGNDLMDHSLCSTPGFCGETFWSNLYSVIVGLLTQMETDGVEHVFLYGLYHAKGITDFTEHNGDFDTYMDTEVIPNLLLEGFSNLTIIPDMRDYFDANSQFLTGDGMHPLPAGSAVVAEWGINEIDALGAIEPSPGTVDMLVKSIPLLSCGDLAVTSINFTTMPANHRVTIRWDGSSYDGDDVYCVLEADGYGVHVNSAVELYNVTDSAYLAQSLCYTPGPSQRVWRSQSFSPALLHDGDEYELHIRSGGIFNPHYLKRATLLVYQRGNVTKTETHIPMIAVKHQDDPRCSTTSPSYTEAFSSEATNRAGLWKYDASKWDGDVTFYFEGNLYCNTAGQNAWAILRDEYANNITASQISKSGTTRGRVRSNAFYKTDLVDGRTYRIAVGSSLEDIISYYHDLRIIVKQENFRSTVSYHRIGTVRNNTNSGVRTGDSQGFWFEPIFGKFNNLTLEACLYTEGATAYGHLKSAYEASDKESLSTTETSRALVQSANPISLETGFTYQFQLVTSNSDYYARSTNPWLVLTYALTQQLSPTGIDSAEAFGSPGQYLVVAINPTGIATDAVFGAPGFFMGSVAVQPAGIASETAFGDPGFSLITYLSPTGIASDAGFGTPSFLPGIVYLSPAGIATAETFGVPGIFPVGFIQPTGIASAENFGDPSLLPGAVSIQPAAIASSEIFGEPTFWLLVYVTPTGIPSTEAFGVPGFQSGAVAIQPASLGSAEAFGSPGLLLSGFILPAGIASAEAFGSPVMLPGAVTVQPVSISSTEAFGEPTFGLLITVSPTGIGTGEAFGSPGMLPGAVVLAPDGIGTAEAFGTPGLLLSGYLSPAGIASDEAFGIPGFGLGTVSIYPTGVPTGAEFGVPAVGAGGVYILPAGIASIADFGTPGLFPGAVSVLPTGIESLEAFGTVGFGFGAVTLTPTGIATAESFGSPGILPLYLLSVTGIPSEDAIGAPSLIPGAVAVFPVGLDSQAAFGSPLVFPAGFIAVVGIPTAEAFGSPGFSFGSVSIQPQGATSSAAFGIPTLLPGAVYILPSGIASASAYGIPTVFSAMLVQPTGIPSSAAFGDPSFLLGTVFANPVGIGTQEAFGTISMSLGAVTLLPIGIGSAEGFGAVLMVPTYRLIPIGISTEALFGAPGFDFGPVTLLPAGIQSGAAFGSPALIMFVQSLFPNGIPSDLVFGAPRIIQMLADPVKIKALDAIEAALATVPGIRLVIRNPSKPIDHDTGKYTMAFIFDEEERKVQRNQYAISTLPIQIEVWMRGKESELADISDRMNADIRRTLLSNAGIRQWCNDIRPDPDNTMRKFFADEFLGGFVSRYTVRFLHVWGNPYNKGN